jgi:hypothetical protein
MATLADSIVTSITNNYGGSGGGGTTPANIVNLNAYTALGPFSKASEWVIVWIPSPAKRTPLNENFANITQDVMVRVITPTSDDRLKEIKDEIISIVNNQAITGINAQWVHTEEDITNRIDGIYAVDLSCFFLQVLAASEVAYSASAGAHTHDDRYYTEAEIDALFLARDTLAEMTDTTISGLADDDILTYDSASGKWINENNPTIGGNVTIGGTVDVTGNITVSGTVDGVDIAARDHAKYTDGEAVTAMGAKGDANALNHDKWTTADTEGVITAEIVNGQSIDNAIDALIATHTAVEAAHGMEHDDLTDTTLTGAYLEDLLMFGSGNATWVPCIFEMIGNSTGTVGKAHGNYPTIQNTDGTDFTLMFHLPIPSVKGSLKLYVGDVRVNLWDVDAGDYVTAVYVYGVTYNSATIVHQDLTNLTTIDSHTVSFGAADFSSYPMVGVRIDVEATNAADFNITSVEAECYYAT